MLKRRLDIKALVESIAIAVVLMVSVATQAVLKAQDFRGSLVGAVVDSSGARVPSADVHLMAVESSLERKTTTDSRGEFRFSDLLAGPYQLTVKAPGFAEATSTVIVNVSSDREVEVTLKPAAAQQTLTVEAQASSIVVQPIDTTSAVHGGVVTAQDLRDHSSGAPQLRQYRLPGAGNRAGGALRSHQGAHHRRFLRRQLRTE